MDNHSMSWQLFATIPKGLELLLVEELRGLGATNVAEKLAGVAFTGDLTVAYKACLWSRLANRILLLLARLPAATPDELYKAVQSIEWQTHMDVHSTFAVHVVSSQSAITHTLYAAQKVKDAIVDQFREKWGIRPSVAREKPAVSIFVYLHRNNAAIYLDLSGESLHKRGYRLAQGEAPLKENLAAAILLRAGFPQIAKNHGALLDPMCGSGTLLIEAAMIAGDVAPGLMRDYQGFLGWKQHDNAKWQAIVTEAISRREQGKAAIPPIIGYDHDADAIKIAFENIERAGYLGVIHVEKRDLEIFAPRPQLPCGLVVVNPPYGERLGEQEGLNPLYKSLGDRLKHYFIGWKAAIFTGNPLLGKRMGLRSTRSYAFFNGAIACKLLLFDIDSDYFVDNSNEAENERRILAAQRAVQDKEDQHIQMFVNRLKKNLKHLTRQAKRKGQASFRVYDADIPEYAFAIDIKEDEVYVQEYPPPSFLDQAKVDNKRHAVLAILPNILNISPRKIFFSVK